MTASRTIARLPAPMTRVAVPALLPASGFDALESKCPTLVVGPKDLECRLTPEPKAVTGSLLHHAAEQVNVGHWAGLDSVEGAFDYAVKQAEGDLRAVARALDWAGLVNLAKRLGRAAYQRKKGVARTWLHSTAKPKSDLQPEAFIPERIVFSKRARSKPLAEVGSEAWLVWPEGRVIGRVDHVEKKGPRRIITDYKTGRTLDKYNEVLEHHELQLWLYALATEAITKAEISLYLRSGEKTRVDWSRKQQDETKERWRKVCDRLPAGIAEADALTAVGPHCSWCRRRPHCAKYLRTAPGIWDALPDMGDMPLDVWGRLGKVERTPKGVRIELDVPNNRRATISGLDEAWGLQALPKGTELYFFCLASKDAKLNREHVHPANFYEHPPPGQHGKQKAHDLRVFRGL